MGKSLPSKQVVFRPVYIRHTAVSTAVAIACAPVMMHAADWQRNSEVFLSAGNNRGLVGVRGLIPLKQDADSLWYTDLRFFTRTGDASNTEGNIGVGHRRFTENDEWILGGYLAYDNRESESGHHWEQLTLGAEALSDVWDLRANLYEALENKKLIGGVPGTSRFVGTGLVQNSFYEEAMSGFDLEAGRLLPIGPDNHEVRGYLGLYHYDGDIVKDADGVSGRLEWRPRRNITVQLAAQSDNLFDDSVRLEVAWSFDRPKTAGKRRLRERMTQFVQRDIDIRETSGLPPTDRDDPGDPYVLIESGGLAHIDDSLGDTLSVVEGNGSIENPYRSFGECLQSTTTNNCGSGATTEYVYVHEGNSISGAAYDTSDANHDGTGGDAAFQLQRGVSLVGEGAAFMGIKAGKRPELTATGQDVLTLLGNNTVSGLSINNDSGSAGNGIYTNTIGTTNRFEITNNIIENLTGDALEINTTNGNDTILISNNTIRNNGVDGIDIDNNAGLYGTSIQNITISNNIITNNTRDGIELFNGANYYGGYDGKATQTFSITNNTINNSGDDGISIYNFSVYDGQSMQTGTISGNTISNNVYGVFFENAGYDAGGSDQTAYISNNVINNNAADGILAFNVSYNNGSDVNQTLNLAGNTISGNGATGLAAYNYSLNFFGFPTSATQIVDMTGGDNQITGSSVYDVLAINFQSIGGTATQIVDMTGGNTVNSQYSVNPGGGTQTITGP